MKKLLTTTIAIASLSCSAAFARIGETYDEAFKRYGKERDIVKDEITGRDIYRFDKGVFHINALLDDDGKIGEIYYIKQADAGWGKTTPMSENEIMNFLRSNRPKGWVSAGDNAWVNGDSLVAFYGPVKDIDRGTQFYRLNIQTKSMALKYLKSIENKETSNQEGF